ncbi:hypothetical protein BKA70DRAFT_582477 [Coprinopsis sp. MPI-PUGE-AT-0042]|nr:hypothetical protein BKA70DRAFT_582477 [Coprinopsis sp. MPI-PUGE-AT-0042]
MNHGREPACPCLSSRMLKGGGLRGSSHSRLIGLRQSQLRPSRMAEQSRPHCFNSFVEAMVSPLKHSGFTTHAPCIVDWTRRVRRYCMRRVAGQTIRRIPDPSTHFKSRSRLGRIEFGKYRWLDDDEKTPVLQNLGRYVTLLPSLPAPIVEIWMGSTRLYRSRWFGLQLNSNCRCGGRWDLWATAVVLRLRQPRSRV